MRRGNALGFIESVGLASAIAAADAALKAANVELIGRENSRGFGYITVKIVGEVGAVQAAIGAAKAVSSNVARVWSTDVIPRPAADLGRAMVWNRDTLGAEEWFLSREPVSGSELPERKEEAPLVKVDEAPLVQKEEAPLAKRPDVGSDMVVLEEKPSVETEAPKAAGAPDVQAETKKTNPRRRSGRNSKKTK